jgi:hypothetical protein
MVQIFYNQKKLTFIRLSLIIFIIACFSIPTFSHAASAGDIIKTPLVELLRDNAGLHDFWGRMMSLVNGFVVILLIVVAFCEILNINISTYGVKKILPSLVFAVLAANFSWIMCRLFIDWANIVMSRFGESTAIIDPLIASRDSFTINVATTMNSSQAGAQILGATSNTDISFFQAGMKTLFVWAGAIALYILTFLLLLRNAIIVSLAVFSPVAFMAMVLPQTKSAFNKWWTTFMQWTFMPTVSVFMLWMGSQVQTLLSPNTDPLIGFLISIGFIYGAIRVPFSMSGAASGIMNKWADMGKKSAKFVGNAAYTYSGAKATVDYQKELMKTRADVTKTKMANKLKDLTGIGSGLDIQKDKLARAQKRSKVISDKKVGEYIDYRDKNAKEGQMTGRQRRYAMEEAESQAMEGTTDMANKRLLSSLAKEAEAGTPLGEKIKTMRTSSQKAGYEIAAFEKDWARLNDEMKTSLMKGTTHEGEDIEKSLKTGIWGKSGKAMTEEEKKTGQAQIDFLRQYGKSMLDGDIAAGTAKSSEGKIVTKIALERQSIDNVVEEQKLSKELVKKLDELEALESIMGPLTATEAQALKDNTAALEAAGYKKDEFTHNIERTTRDSIRTRETLATDSYRDKIADITARYGSTRDSIPAFLQNSLQFNPATRTITDLLAMGIEERKQVNKLVTAKIKEDATEEVEKHGTAQIASSIQNGREGDWDRQQYLNWASGNGAKNDPKANEKLIAAVEGLGANIEGGLRVALGTSGEAIRGKIDAYYAGGQGLARMKKMAEQINKSYDGKMAVNSNGTAKQIYDEIHLLVKGGVDAVNHIQSRSISIDPRQRNVDNKAQTIVASVLKKPDNTSGGNSSRLPSEV